MGLGCQRGEKMKKKIYICSHLDDNHLDKSLGIKVILEKISKGSNGLGLSRVLLYIEK